MATITTANNNSALNSSRRSYVAVKDFNNSDFSSYTVAMNSSYVNIGTLSAVTTDAALAPKGRVLRENGRKLYPGANPGVTRYLVGVYDSETSLSGFIDPNSPTFTIFNSDRPNYIPVTDEVDIGAPVYTAGTIEADGAATLNDGLSVTGGATVRTATITTATYTSVTGYIVYTAANSFVAGETVTVSGVKVSTTLSAKFNVTGIVFSASYTDFVIHSITGLGTVTSDASTGTASLVQPTLVVDDMNTQVTGGLVLTNASLTQTVVKNTTTLTGAFTLDLTQGNVFYFSVGQTGALIFTVNNNVIGSTFYISIVGDATHSVTIAGITNNTIAVSSGLFTDASPTVALTMPAKRTLLTCVVVSA